VNAAFDALSPSIVLEAVEAAYGIVPDGSLTPYSSYVNRVYGLRAEGGQEYIVKFYRPGRWTEKAILEEHQFLADCAQAELPVVAPLSDAEGQTLSAIEIEGEAEAPIDREALMDSEAPAAAEAFFFALFPKRGGRSFDAESESDWLRLGSLAGRLHLVGAEAWPADSTWLAQNARRLRAPGWNRNSPSPTSPSSNPSSIQSSGQSSRKPAAAFWTPPPHSCVPSRPGASMATFTAATSWNGRAKASFFSISMTW